MGLVETEVELEELSGSDLETLAGNWLDTADTESGIVLSVTVTKIYLYLQ